MTSATNLNQQADTADFELFIEQELRGRSGPDRAELEHYLRTHPGDDIRDWKHGSTRDLLNPQETDCYMPSSGKTEYVRALATRELARRLPREVRQAAGQDDALAWNELARRYRPRQAGER